jgi:hypothetical protein
VTWLDAWSDDEGPDPDAWRGRYPVHTVGWLVRETSEVLSLAAERLPDGEGFRAVTHIPKPLLRSVLLR